MTLHKECDLVNKSQHIAGEIATACSIHTEFFHGSIAHALSGKM